MTNTFFFMICLLVELGRGVKVNMLVSFQPSLKPIEDQHPSLTPTPSTVPKFFGLFMCSPAALVRCRQSTGEQLLLMINTYCTQEALYQSLWQQFASSEHGGAFNSFTADLLLRIWKRPKWVEKLSTYEMVTCLLYFTFFF